MDIGITDTWKMPNPKCSCMMTLVGSLLDTIHIDSPFDKLCLFKTKLIALCASSTQNPYRGIVISNCPCSKIIGVTKRGWE